MGNRLIIVGMVENEQGYGDFTDTSVHFSQVLPSTLVSKTCRLIENNLFSGHLGLLAETLEPVQVTVWFRVSFDTQFVLFLKQYFHFGFGV